MTRSNELIALAALAVAVMLSSTTAAAHAEIHAAHVHGLARLAVVVDGPLLSIGLESPLHNLVGFEHRPRTAEQGEAMARMIAALNAPADLFAPTAAAACTPVRIAIESPWLSAGQAPGRDDDEGQHHDHDHDHPHENGHDGRHDHADLYAEFDFHCDKPAELLGLGVELFGHFAGIERIYAEMAVPGGQSATWLVPGRRDLRWR